MEIELPGNLTEVVLTALLSIPAGDKHYYDEKTVNGLRNAQVKMAKSLPPNFKVEPITY